MKKGHKHIIKLLLMVVIILIVVGIFFLLNSHGFNEARWNDNRKDSYEEKKVQKTEGISCASTEESKCYLYRCNSGYIESIEIPAPGMVPYKCSDGSSLEMVKEVN